MKKLLFLIAILLTSCSYRVEKQKDDPLGKISGSLGFSEVTALVFSPKCARCHGNEWVGNFEATHALMSQISQRIQSAQPGFMMPPQDAVPLTDDERNAVLSWIARGGPKSGGDDTLPPPPPALNFAGVSAKVLKPRCIRCHDTDFDTFEHTSPLITEIEFRVQAIGQDEQMPPERSTQLTDEEKAFLLEWIRAGAPKE